MGKYCGTIGYGITSETAPGVWEATIVERTIFGDSFKNTSSRESSENLNDDIRLSTKISFLADPYALQNFHLIKFVSYLGSLWKIKSVDEDYPRLILTLGGVYNDER